MGGAVEDGDEAIIMERSNDPFAFAGVITAIPLCDYITAWCICHKVVASEYFFSDDTVFSMRRRSTHHYSHQANCR